MIYSNRRNALNVAICNYFFGRDANFIRLWKTKRFQIFNHHLLEELSLLQKLRFVKAIIKVPKNIGGDIERINALRNGLAHAFFTENLRKSKPEYKGKDILTLPGVGLVIEDMSEIAAFFIKANFVNR